MSAPFNFFDAPTDSGMNSNSRRLILNSYSHRRGPLRPAPTEGLLFDVRGVPNPPRELRAEYNGTSPELREYLMQDEAARKRVGDIAAAINSHLEGIRQRGDHVDQVTVGLGCELGKNRSVACAEELARLRWPEGWTVEVRHRELPRPR
ncbi:putative P-loop ATPase protein family protein [Lyophyllum shimeji]|uniref:P-loop ATPase protein family protein n=1 Tax=Lyophyllum shimeji TaxID=47721 RepID=A0A9P3UTU4_LYOSH|nr:putative P-loop ATPase protein family protein [Lyophyllum shimeji]